MGGELDVWSTFGKKRVVVKFGIVRNPARGAGMSNIISSICRTIHSIESHSSRERICGIR